MLAIGASVQTPDFGPGFVVGIGGAAQGRIGYRIARPTGGNPIALDVTDAEIEPGPALPEFTVGQAVHVHAGSGIITARNGDAYEVMVIRERPSGVVLAHRYPHVLPHEIILS